MFEPRLEILPPAQRSLWRELNGTPSHFVLYGGTAIALRLGHRQSQDFDFFTNDKFQPSDLLGSVPYLRGARVDQRGDNTLTALVDRNGPVKVSFFGDVGMNHVVPPDIVNDVHIQVASLLDLAATKLKTIQQRAEAKDYQDLDAAISNGINLAEALAAATAVYGRTFNAIAALKALSFFEDGNLASLPASARKRLNDAANAVEFEALPKVDPQPGIVRPPAQ